MSPALTPAAAPAPRITCLVVDDLDENLLALSELVRRADVDVVTAHSGDEALERLLAHDVALALIDVQMPGMDGFQLAEIMRGSERTRAVPIIFVTAGGQDRARMFKGYDAGAVDFLYKPVEPHVLRNKADVFFQLHRQRLQISRELLERTETLRMHEMFTAVLGHDLRSPLSAIMMAAEMTMRKTPDADARKRNEAILQSARGMNRLINDMLDLARARLGGGIALEPVSCDLLAIVEPVLAELRTRYPAITFEVEQSGGLVGQWDADRIAQVVSNLVGNAIKHGHAGQPVRVSLSGDGPAEVMLAVENAGSVAPDMRHGLFDPFHTTRPTGGAGGLGLGLYIAQQIVQSHDGTILVEHLANERTRFVVTLPRMRLPLSDGGSEDARPAPAVDARTPRDPPSAPGSSP